jgi:predicted amidohydrolase YtcJ
MGLRCRYAAHTWAIAVLCFAPACARQPVVEPADLVLRGGTVVTVDEARPSAEALAVRGDTIAAVGTNRDIESYVGPATRVIELNGALAIPGLIESHAHFARVGEAARILKLGDARSWDDIVQMVADAAARATPGEWILGRGWHQEKWTAPPPMAVDGFPVHAALSAASPRNPVWLTHASGHAGFANARAMALAGVTARTAAPAGGQLLADQAGNPTGLFNETAQSLITAALARERAKRTPTEIEADLRRDLELAARESLAKGLTTVSDAGSPPATVDVLKKMVDAGALPIRVWLMLRDTPDRLAAALPRYRLVNYGDQRLTVRAIKRSIDGALGSRGAWMLEPYADAPATTGLNTDPLENIRQVAELAIAHDLQLAIHAIGDRGNREALDLMEEAFRTHPARDGRQRRWRIEHAQHLHPNDVPRFARLGIIASMQGVHATSDAPFVVPRLGPHRAEQGAYIWRTLLLAGARIANGTDAPVEDINPLASFYASVTRRTADGTVFYPDQRMTRLEALRSYTIDAAYAAFDDDIKGSLTPGKLADITVLSRDIMTIPEDQIPSTEVLYTIVGGRVEFSQ